RRAEKNTGKAPPGEQCPAGHATHTRTSTSPPVKKQIKKIARPTPIPPAPPRPPKGAGRLPRVGRGPPPPPRRAGRTPPPPVPPRWLPPARERGPGPDNPDSEGYPDLAVRPPPAGPRGDGSGGRTRLLATSGRSSSRPC